VLQYTIAVTLGEAAIGFTKISEKWLMMYSGLVFPSGFLCDFVHRSGPVLLLQKNGLTA
jgi:hypothetical protein